MSILATVRAAFGPRATLYSVLGCDGSSEITSADLKRAYRKAALKHHPDRCTDDSEAASTLKFQAVSAAYQVLMDEGRRAIYDATGRIAEEEEGDVSDEGDAGSSPSKARSAPRGASQRQWEQFFHSVFDEIISTGTKHATEASSYRGSDEERRDVLQYYNMCKGDMKKVVDCIVHGSPGDVARWTRDIVQPAVEAGEVEDYSKCSGDEKNCNGKFSKSKRTLLEESSEDEVVVGETRQSNRAALEDSSEDEKVIKKPSSGRRRLAKGNRNDNSLLEDTDDEEEGDKAPQRRQSSLSASTSASAGMSKKDKMDFRVAKKRKARAQKDMEMAGIIQSKNWSVDSEYTRRRPKKQNMGGISDALLSNIERKYGGKERKKR